MIYQFQVRLVNDQFVKKAIGEPPDRYCLPPDFIAKNTSEEDSFMAKTTDILLSELENIDSTKLLTAHLQCDPPTAENPLTSNSSFSPPSSKESSEIGIIIMSHFLSASKKYNLFDRNILSL